MAWFGIGRGPSKDSGQDVALEALRNLLDKWADSMPPTRRVRLDTLRDRLQRPPVPTGLDRELQQVWDDLSPKTASPTRDRQHAKAAGELARTLTATMKLTAMVDQNLHQKIDALTDEIPAEIGIGDARRIKRTTRALKRLAVPARKRTLEERAQMNALIRDLTKELGVALKTSASMDEGLGALKDELMDPDAVATVREALLTRVRRLASDASSLRNELTRAEGRSRSLEDLVADQAKLLVDIKAEAALDSLTQLCHRGTFDTAMTDSAKHARLAELPLALLVMDIDHFKKVNDTYGHPVGDEVLKQVSRCLETQVREGDIVGRMGGEEFGVLLPGANETVAVGVAERIRTAIGALRMEADERRYFKVTISIGASMLVDGDTAQSLYQRTDRALYEAKANGRNQTILKTPPKRRRDGAT